jgi:TetR/AcrR family transcriptional regulator, mexJK operon transcriptional repressor
MSATKRNTRQARRYVRPAAPRADDPRVLRTRAAVVEAARALFLRDGYAGTTMEGIAAAAGLTKRTLYNNYGDKESLFQLIIADVLAHAEAFVRALHEEFAVGLTRANVHQAIEALAVRMAAAILRPEIIALRRLLIGEARDFPALGAEYFRRAPEAVIDALADGFAILARRRVLTVREPRIAAAQFAYLIVGEPLDRALMTGVVASPEVEIVAGAREGAATFLARYGRAVT